MNERKNRKRIPKLLRTAAIAAALTAALAVTANAASDGLLFEELRIIFNDGFHMVLEAEDGSQMEAYSIGASTELRDGRLILAALGEEIDITDELAANGTYTHTAAREGVEVEITVTGTLEEHTVELVTADMTYSFDQELGENITVTTAEYDGTSLRTASLTD